MLDFQTSQQLGIAYRSEIGWSADSLLSFFHDRLKVYLRDKGVRHDVIDACLAMPGNDDLTLVTRRAEALAGSSRPRTGRTCFRGSGGPTTS